LLDLHQNRLQKLSEEFKKEQEIIKQEFDKERSVNLLNSIYFPPNTRLGHSRKHPYLPHRGNWKLTPLPPLDVLIHLLLSETIFSPLPFQTAEISSVGGV
jgi:hypothetical protein